MSLETKVADLEAVIDACGLERFDLLGLSGGGPASVAYAARHPEVMWVGCPVTATGGLAAGTAELVRARSAKATALLIGPGMGAEAETLGLAAHLVGEAKVPLVLDADALRPEVVARVLSKPFIGTPHAGEFERIAPALFTDGNFTAPQGVLVLKGPLTRVTDGTSA